MNLRIQKVTTLHVYLEWDKPAGGAIGYWLFRDGVRVSWIGNGDQTTTRFLKPLTGSAVYTVLALLPGPVESVSYPQSVPRPADPLMPLRGA